MIEVVIEPQSSPATINVRFDDSVSLEELRAAWQDVSSGILERHIRDAISFECARRGISPGEIIPELNS